MSGKPRIAVLMDENTSTGGTRYDMTKAYFKAVHDAGGLPFGIPYFEDIVAPTVAEFDGLLGVGGRFAYPNDWYVDGMSAKSPVSERFDVEKALMQGFLAKDKPVLGLCAGMQMLVCLHGGRLLSDVKALGPQILPHDDRESPHTISIKPGTLLSRILGETDIEVNTFHREAIGQLSDAVIASAHAPDGVIEAIELPVYRFALGVQWHQELFVGTSHPGQKIFEAFIQAARRV